MVEISWYVYLKNCDINKLSELLLKSDKYHMVQIILPKSMNRLSYSKQFGTQEDFNKLLDEIKKENFMSIIFRLDNMEISIEKNNKEVFVIENDYDENTTKKQYFDKYIKKIIDFLEPEKIISDWVGSYGSYDIELNLGENYVGFLNPTSKEVQNLGPEIKKMIDEHNTNNE